MISGLLTDTLRAQINATLNHKLIDAKINIDEEIQLIEKFSIKSSSKLEATSPSDAKFSLEHTSQVGLSIDEISGNNHFKGSFVTGPVDGDVTLTQSLAFFPWKSKADIKSTLEISSTAFQAQNQIVGSLTEGQLSIVSSSAAFEDMLTHNAEITLTSRKCAFKSDTKALALNIHHAAEANIGAEDISIMIETRTSNSEDHINSQFVAALNMNGLLINSDSSVKLAEHTATHKASVTLDKNGLVTSGRTSVNSLLTLTNTFNGILHSSKCSLSAETKGKFQGAAIDNTISISATMFSLDLESKSRLDFAQDIWYTYDISVQVEPYKAFAGVTSQLKLASETELKNTCEIKLADLTGNAKCSTTGKLIGAHMSHDIEMEIVGLSVKINSDGRFHSQLFHFSTTLQATAAPFTFNLHALTNGEGELYLYGKHSAQVYNKVLLKAEPLALAHSNECRFSTKHELDNNVIFEANFDKKADTQLSLSEQSATVIVKSKINNNVFNQEISVYNNHERIGLEVSGVVTFVESQDFSISALIQYDKNTENHVITLPVAESLLAVLESLKSTSVTLVEALQDYIKREEFTVKIQTLLQHFTDTVTGFNLEQKVAKLKRSLITLSQNCPIMTKKLEDTVNDLRAFTLQAVAHLNTCIKETQELILSGALSDTVMQKLASLNEEYDIRAMLLAIIEAIENMIKEIDMTKLEDSGITYDVKKLNIIKMHLQQYATDLKNVITDFDKAQFVDQMQNIITTTEMYTEHLLTKFPREDIIKVADTLMQLITKLDIIDRCKLIYSSFREVVVKYELDKKTEEFLNKLLELVKQLKIDKTVLVLVNTLKSVQIPFPHILDNALTYLKTTDIKEIIDDLNKLIEAFVKPLKSFEYNEFVDEVNQKLSEFTVELKKLIVSLELSQKLEALREFINYALSSMSTYFEQIRSAKVSEVMKTVKNLMDTLFLNDLKNMDLREELLKALQQVSDIYNKVLSVLTNAINDCFEVTKVLGNQQIVTELKQIIENVAKALQTFEVEIPPFTVPLTDLALPSKKFSLQQLQEVDLPVKFSLPNFTILGHYTVPEMTITYDDIKEILIGLADIIINIGENNYDAYVGKLTANLPDLSTVTLPVVTLPHISLPAIPKLNGKHILDIPLQIPDFSLPKIPNTLILPAFGKLQGRIKVNSPVYALSTIVELRNSTDNKQRNHFIALINSVGESSSCRILNYTLDATVRIGLPKMSRVVIADTFKFWHSTLSVEHQASVMLYGLSAQATAQTNLKVTTMPYTADISNKAFFAVEGGMSASSETAYKHRVNIPFLSLTSDASLNQSAVVLQKDATIELKVGNAGTGTFALSDYSDEGTHKSDMLCIIAPTSVKLTFNGDTDSTTLKFKETLNVEAFALSHIDFNSRIETQSLLIKNSVIIASGRAHLGRMKVEVEATHDTELTGTVSGTLSNTVNIKVHPLEIIVDIQNKGNGKVSLNDYIYNKFDLQNYYALILNSKKQHVNTVALLRFGQNKYGFNLTIDNNNVETGIYTTVNGETDLEFLTIPFNIPETVIPVIDLTIPAINNINLYETTGLKYLYTTKPTIDVNAKIVYQKRWFAPIDLGFISFSVPAIGNLISETSFKSSIFNLITNAGIYGDNDLIIRIAATSTSVFEGLQAKLEGTSSLTLRRGLKLASALSLMNAFIEGTHNSTLTVNTETLEAVVAVTTAANMNLPILKSEVNHKLLVDTKPHPNAASTLRIKHTFDLPIIKAVGSSEAEHILKVDAAASYISLESITKGMIDGTFLEPGTVKGALDNEANIHLTGAALRSKLKTVGNININHGSLKVVYDINENFDMESALSHVYAVMNIVSNNEVKFATFNTKGKHTAKATVDLVPMISLSANVEFDLAQPTTLGEYTMYEKTVVDLTLFKQKVSHITKMFSPVYTTNIEVEMEGDAPIFKLVFKSSSTSPVVLLEYDLDSKYSLIIKIHFLMLKMYL